MPPSDAPTPDAKTPSRGLFRILFDFLFALPLWFRFLISGGIGTVLNLMMVYLLTDIMGIWYLYSTTIAFVISFFVSFTLQKFFTFQDHALDTIRAQAPKYLAVALINMGLNALSMYLLVERFGFHYLIAQICTIATISIESFLVYHYIVFKKK